MCSEIWLKIILKLYKSHHTEAPTSLAPIGVFGILGSQYIMGRVLSYFVILKSSILQYLMLVSINSSIDFCVCEYADVEFLFLFGEPSANSLEM